ncbi:MAG: 3'-5' exonuclease, partial [Coprococcus sp.]
ELKAAYRSTCEITDYTNSILSDKKDAAEVIERHGKVPELISAADCNDAASYIAEKLQYGDMDSYDNVAVLCEDESEAYMMYNTLEEYTETTLLTAQSSVYSGGVVVLPRFLAKGMEFDAVFVISHGMSNDNLIERQSFYIACTRALHVLYVINMEK